MEENKNEIEVFSSLNEQEVNQVCAILSDNNIPFLKKEYGGGSYINIVMGQSIQEKKIFVNEENYDKAIELISSITSCDDFEKTEAEELENIDDNDDSDKKRRIARWFLFFCVFGMPFITIIIATILSLFQKTSGN